MKNKIAMLIASVMFAGAAVVAQNASLPVGAMADSAVVLPAVSFGDTDLSMLTNHAVLAKYALKHVMGVSANVTCSSEVDNNNNNSRFYQYTNSPKSLDDIQSSLLANEVWWLHVTSPTDMFNTTLQLVDATNSWDKPNPLFSGGTSAPAQQDQYGQWALPDWAEDLPMYLAPQIKIVVTNCMMLNAVIIARDQNGNPYPVYVGTDGNGGFYFPSQYAGFGVLVLSGYLPIAGQPGWYQYYQSAINLADGKPTPLYWVDAKIILKGSTDMQSFKDARDLSCFIWTWSGIGTVPLEVATFTIGMTNVLLNTTTSEGQYATSYSVENASTGVSKTYAVPAGATSVTTGTNILKGVYYIIPNGINLAPMNVVGTPVIGKG